MTGTPIPGGTIAETTRQIARALAAAGLSDAASEARWLISAALGLSSADLVSRSDDAITAVQATKLAAYLDRRLRHEPLSRIAGQREFYGRVFDVTPATLDPRPDTETLIDAALEMLSGEARVGPLRILDIGTGTGCILLTLLAVLPQAIGIGTDISHEALAVARANADHLGLAHRATFIAADLGADVASPFDVVVSNPPYIRSGDIAGLAPAVRQYDPHLALDGGADGLEMYRRIVADLARLVPNGFVLLETGHDQAQDVADLLRARCAKLAPNSLRIFNDVAGIPRVVAARTRTVT